METLLRLSFDPSGIISLFLYVMFPVLYMVLCITAAQNEGWQADPNTRLVTPKKPCKYFLLLTVECSFLITQLDLFLM